MGVTVSLALYKIFIVHDLITVSKTSITVRVCNNSGHEFQVTGRVTVKGTIADVNSFPHVVRRRNSMNNDVTGNIYNDELTHVHICYEPTSDDTIHTRTLESPRRVLSRTLH